MADVPQVVGIVALGDSTKKMFLRQRQEEPESSEDGNLGPDLEGANRLNSASYSNPSLPLVYPCVPGPSGILVLGDDNFDAQPLCGDGFSGRHEEKHLHKIVQQTDCFNNPRPKSAPHSSKKMKV